MSITLPVKAVPGASRTCIAGWLGRELKIRISAPPEKGKANSSIERLLADRLGLKARQVRIVKGQTSAHKIVQLDDIAPSALFDTLGKPGQ